MSALPGGGGLVTRLDPHARQYGSVFSVTAHTTGAAASQDILFVLPAGVPKPKFLYVWYTNESTHFIQLPAVPDSGMGHYELTLLPNAFYSISTTTGQGVPAPSQPIPPSAAFPFPYNDSFDTYLEVPLQLTLLVLPPPFMFANTPYL